MKKLIMILISFFLIHTLASAQNEDHTPRALGYGFFGAGTHKMSQTAGFGVEGYLTRGLALGVEGAAAGWSTKDNYGGSNILGVASADTSYHFFPKKITGNAAPFAAGGYTLFFGRNATLVGKDVTVNGFNIGGGTDVLVSKHVGVRFDVRYYGHGGRILKNTYPDLAEFSFVAFRIGVTFR